MNHSTRTPDAVKSDTLARAGRVLALGRAWLAAHPPEEEVEATEADRAAWSARDQGTAGLTAADEQALRDEHEARTIPALDWHLDQVPAEQWDRWAEERQAEWGAAVA